jgi:hypothetical protein
MLTRAAAPTMPLNTITAPKVILNKTSRRNTVFSEKGGEKKEFLLRVVAKNGSGKNSIQPGVSGLIMGFGLC